MHLFFSKGLAYAINTLYFVYLRTIGVNTASHGVRKELDRVKSYITKIKTATLGKEKRKEAVDKAAAERWASFSIFFFDPYLLRHLEIV